METQLFQRLEELYPDMVQIRRQLHQYPELSFQEVKTPQMIAEYLKSIGVEVRTNVGGRGVVGYIKGGKPGKTVAIRADFDALPIQEETNLPFASKHPGVMHACGHDAHTATLLVLAKALMETRAELSGTIVLIHQFAEELAPGGAIEMIKAGCLENVDVIFGTHVWSSFPYGMIGYREGAIMAAADRFELTIYGKGGHGASPHETVDAITVGSSIVAQLQQLVSRNIDPLKSAVLSVGSFHAGNAFNVIADQATLVGTVRTFDVEIQDYLIERMEQVIKGICDAMNASYSFHYVKGYPSVINDRRITKQFRNLMSKSLTDVKVEQVEPVMGGEDFAYYLQRVPGIFFFTGAGKEDDTTYPHHHPKFDIDERAMLIAAKALGKATIAYLANSFEVDITK